MFRYVSQEQSTADKQMEKLIFLVNDQSWFKHVSSSQQQRTKQLVGEGLLGQRPTKYAWNCTLSQLQNGSRMVLDAMLAYASNADRQPPGVHESSLRNKFLMMSFGPYSLWSALTVIAADIHEATPTLLGQNGSKVVKHLAEHGGKYASREHRIEYERKGFTIGEHGVTIIFFTRFGDIGQASQAQDQTEAYYALASKVADTRNYFFGACTIFPALYKVDGLLRVLDMCKLQSFRAIDTSVDGWAPHGGGTH